MAYRGDRAPNRPPKLKKPSPEAMRQFAEANRKINALIARVNEAAMKQALGGR